MSEKGALWDYLKDYALNASGLQGEMTLPLATINQVRYKTRHGRSP